MVDRMADTSIGKLGSGVFTKKSQASDQLYLVNLLGSLILLVSASSVDDLEIEED